MKRSDELLNAINKYFGFSGVSPHEETKMHYYGSDITVQEFVDMLQTGQMLFGDAPDMLIRKDNVALIIEHFEFDSYIVTRKGSQNRREQSRVERLENNLIPTENGVYYHDAIHGFSSYQNYVKNVCRNFNEHYLQISTYKKNLISKGLIKDSTLVKVLFFIEDTSPLGSMVVDQKDDSCVVRAVCLGQCPEFLSLLVCKPDVNFVLACSEAGLDQIIWFIDRNEITEYQKEALNYSKMSFIASEPKVVGFKKLIPNNLQ